ncbi:FAD/NAD(P)-binding domain-containing protein [Punctularia strigosozonata HHB-11173 SS5]|uniref:FAD/NAD(P)-binding domain-containing protein n=1 Tax=Punctularia strigosozonata (strain HHB-11173) TaxID=741275 RepID=UPI0004417747|nr:FAD/NAD(P)-binding domain-containing protein [Punctularia strigosozonata HHB-11173 SS5]EIN12794.1 FAD/NAD(P)-binding domain-containing protein [Punctularia strigosozonata HHB-11173 SS5]
MKVAVVGSGVSGTLTSISPLLNEHSKHEVHLYEADSRPGGHANTVRFVPPEGSGHESVDVDTGFIVCNPSTYPNFLGFLRSNGDIKINATEMTFAVSRDRGLFEWAGDNLFTIFCQPWRVLDPRMWELIYDVLRFNACSRELITGTNKRDTAENEQLSIGEYLEREHYSDSFRDNYLIPMTAAVWSTPPDKCSLGFPARTLIKFMHNHHLLQITGKPKWLTIQGGSRSYVRKIISALPDGHLHLSAPVLGISSRANPDAVSGHTVSVKYKTQDGHEEIEEYDHVILACHSDTALSMLAAGDGGASPDEKRILGRVRWNRNVVVLHSDISLMPRRRLAWSCWNYLTESATDENGTSKANNDQVALTYWMNELQHLPEDKHGPVLVTLNPPFEPAPDRTFGRYQYDHPILDAEAVLSQNEMTTIQGKRGISYAGAWLKYGFHEDGFTSGLRAAADHIPAVQAPFGIKSPDRDPDMLWLPIFFHLFERSGAKTVVAVVAGFWLRLVRVVIGHVVDLTQLESELRTAEKRRK